MTEYDVNDPLDDELYIDPPDIKEDPPGTLVGFEKPDSKFDHYADPPDEETELAYDISENAPAILNQSPNPGPGVKDGMDCSCGAEFKDKNPKRIKGFEYQVEDDSQYPVPDIG